MNQGPGVQQGGALHCRYIYLRIWIRLLRIPYHIYTPENPLHLHNWHSLHIRLPPQPTLRHSVTSYCTPYGSRLGLSIKQYKDNHIINHENSTRQAGKFFKEQLLCMIRAVHSSKTAHVAPIFKKGSPSAAENYSPVSLTCIPCKSLRGHLDKFGVLTPLNHGFRKQHACESQLLITVQDLINRKDKARTQIDVGVLDFAKAFDKVPHIRLMSKLRLYGIHGEVAAWISSFLSQRSQQVVVDGCTSDSADVKSGVPQGTVMGPLLFLLFINDLPQVVDPGTQVHLFADDCLIYRTIKSIHDQVQMQKDLDALQLWGDYGVWNLMHQNAICSQCPIWRIPLQNFTS